MKKMFSSDYLYMYSSVICLKLKSYFCFRNLFLVVIELVYRNNFETLFYSLIYKMEIYFKQVPKILSSSPIFFLE